MSRDPGSPRCSACSRRVERRGFDVYTLETAVAGGWKGSDRKARLPHDWQTRRIRVLRRDGYACQWRLPDGGPCLAPANQVDHVIPGDDHSLANLQALCRTHHNEKSSAEGVAARIPRLRAPEAHPGAI